MLSNLAILACGLFLIARPANAIVNGQLDNFEDGTTMGWAGDMLQVKTGGPAGAADHYLELTADGAGSGGRLTTFNLQQWLGNYIAQSVNTIQIDLRNESTTTLSIRVAFKSQNLMNSPGYLSAPVILAVGSGWQHFSISIAAANMIAIGGPAAYNTFFSTGIGDARIINEAGATDLNGDFVVGQLGIDNIHAVPEPASAALLTGGLLLFAVGCFARLREPRSIARDRSKSLLVRQSGQGRIASVPLAMMACAGNLPCQMTGHRLWVEIDRQEIARVK